MRRREESQREARDRDRRLKGPVSQIAREHPAYGYRRILVELLGSFGLRVNHKRLRRVLNRWELALPRRVSKPRSRARDN